MCINCFDCLKSFNDFKINCINIHEKLVQLDMDEKITAMEPEEQTTEEYFIEVPPEVLETVDYKSDQYDEVESESNYESILAVEKIIQGSCEEHEDLSIPRTIHRKITHARTEESSSIRGKEIYKRLLQSCTICGKMIEKNRMDGHINKHNNVRPYSCPECKKEFYCKQLLRLHRSSIHTNIKLKCDICDKFFPSSRALYAHTLRHKNENRYVCTLCDKKFNNANSLKRHEAIHSGVREFVCTVCGVGFYRKFNLDVHVKNVHNQAKEFICMYDDCKKNFGYARLLKDHVKKFHQNIKIEHSEF